VLAHWLCELGPKVKSDKCQLLEILFDQRSRRWKFKLLVVDLFTSNQRLEVESARKRCWLHEMLTISWHLRRFFKSFNLLETVPGEPLLL